MAGGIIVGAFALESANGLTTKEITIDDSGVPFLDTDKLIAKSGLGATRDAPLYACRAWVNFNGINHQHHTTHVYGISRQCNRHRL